MENAQTLRTIEDVPVDGKRVLVRVDFNVSVGPDGKIDATEDYRIETALQTIQELQQKRCRIALLTHRGRMGDEASATDLEPIRRRLSDLLKEDVRSLKHLFGDEIDTALTSMEPGTAVLLPNVRLDERETLGSEKFAKEIGQHYDVFINEAFSVSHRAHTSVSMLPRVLPSCAGRRTVLEAMTLDSLRLNPERPYVAITSGAKIATKVGMLRRLLGTVDKLCVGGQIANVFLAAEGRFPEAGFHANDIAVAKDLLQVAAGKIILPIDIMTGSPDGADVQILNVSTLTKTDSFGIWDVGPATVELFANTAAEAKTVMWNGPLGKFEVEAYAQSTHALAEKLAALENFRVVGGGDTVIALEKARLVSKFNHVSIGGGAMVAYLEGKRMPGLEPLYNEASHG